MRERVALVTFDAQADQRLSGGESIRLHQIRSAMCAPLWSGERIIGVIQVDSPFHVGAFGERDLDFLTALANYAAVAVERIRYAEQGRVRAPGADAARALSLAGGDRGGAAQGGTRGCGACQSAQATVLFADLVGFTAFAENAPPEEVAESLDAFLDLAVEAIFRAGGTLDKFIGDCVMAFFGAPVAAGRPRPAGGAGGGRDPATGSTVWSAGARRPRGSPASRRGSRSTAARWWWATSAAPGASTTRCSATP